MKPRTSAASAGLSHCPTHFWARRQFGELLDIEDILVLNGVFADLNRTKLMYAALFRMD